jgi:hypothetical protein
MEPKILSKLQKDKTGSIYIYERWTGMLKIIKMLIKDKKRVYLNKKSSTTYRKIIKHKISCLS